MNGYVDVTGIGEDTLDVPNGGNAPNNELPSVNKEVVIDRIREERLNQETGEHEYLVKFKPVKETWMAAGQVDVFPELVQAFQV
jgi:hypothetical protein